MSTKTDVYNDMVKDKHPPIQIVMDYTDDVAERMIMKVPQEKMELA